MLDGEVDSIKAIYECLRKDPCRIVRHEAGFVLGEVNSDIAINYMSEAMLELQSKCSQAGKRI